MVDPINALKSVALAAAVAMSVAACDGDVLVPVCPAIATPAISVSLVDSTTNASFAGSAVVTARDGTFVDSVVTPAGYATAGVAHDRPGTYSLQVRAPDYVTWSAAGLRVTKATCGVNTVELVARLQKDTSTTFQLNYAGRGEFADRGLVRAVFTSGQFRLDLDSAGLYPKTFVIPTHGAAEVRFSLVAAAGDTLAKHVVTFDLKPNWSYGLSAIVGAQSPAGVCGLPTAVPLRSPTGAVVSDSLYVLLAGLPRGAVC